MTLDTAFFDKPRAQLRRARSAFDSRVPRERMLMFFVAMALVGYVADALWVTPAYKQWAQARTRHDTASAGLQRLHDDVARQGAESRAQEQQQKRDLDQLRERVQRTDAELHQVGSSLIPAADMLPVLERMLAQVGGLRLRAMQSLGRTELVGTALPAATAASAAGATSALSAKLDAGPVLYRHGFELTLEGSYADLLAYLQALEAMPQHVLWGGVQFKVEQYPRALLTLRLYTLSLDRSWLEI
jgi:MSHA biogenesis protein MshJ